MPEASLAEMEWLRLVAEGQPRAAQLLARSPDEQRQLGYFHTLREICQQPATWLETCNRMLASAAALETASTGIRTLLLTGSGSSEYAGDCVRFPLQNELGIVAQAIAGGAILTHGSRALPPGRPALMVSLARSGDSPESVGALSLLLEIEPEIRHLVLTCNAKGRLATTYTADPRVTVIALDDRTNDQSLVMTSSFTNMALAARLLGMLDRREAYRSLCRKLSSIVEDLIRLDFDSLAGVAEKRFNRAIFLGSGPRFGAAREAALKMLEMTAGHVSTMCETYLGFRHGPMSFANERSLFVCFFSSDPTLRAYESDLLRELNRKELGMAKLVIGEDVPRDLICGGDVVIDCAGLGEVGDENAPVVDVVAGQLLAFFRCMEEGLHPDSPSEGGVINRVVESFKLHLPQGNGVK